MAEKTCTVCDGNGGHFETENGGNRHHKRWITCPVCKGTGKA